MEHDEESEKKQPPRRPRQSEIRRHGFGSPEGMEMTDIPARNPAAEPDVTQRQQDSFPSPVAIASSSSLSPLEVASATALTSDSTPPSAVVANLSPSSEAKKSNVDESDAPPSPVQAKKDVETPKKLRKRRLFFTPSRRKSKNVPPLDTTTSVNPNPNQQQQQTMPMISPISPRIQQGSTPSSTTAPRPSTQFRTPQLRTPGSRTATPAYQTSNRPQSSRQISGRVHGRRRQTGAPMPSGLSGYSTPRSGRRRQPPTSSGRRNFNPLERISDIFSPQSPSFSPASPIASDDVPDDGFSDSSFSEDSASGSVKEPFAEQVERLDQLLATPSQQLGELALTTSDQNYRSDDDLDDEMEGLESSRRLLAEELSRVEFSSIGRRVLGGDEGDAKTPESLVKTPSASPDQKLSSDNEKEIDWVPLLEVEGKHPPDFSPFERYKQGSETTPKSEIESGFSPAKIPIQGSAQSKSVIKDTSVYSGDEYSSPRDTTSGDTIGHNEEEEDKKPAARDQSMSDQRKPPPPSRSSPLIPKFRKKKSIYKYESLDTPPRRKALPSTARDKARETDSKIPATPPKPEESERQPLITQSKAESEQQGDSKESAMKVYSPESVFNPIDVSSRVEAKSSSVDGGSGLEEGSIPPLSPVGGNRNADFSTDDEYALAVDSMQAADVEHSRRVLDDLENTSTRVDEESREQNQPTVTPGSDFVTSNEAQTRREETSTAKTENEKEILFTPPRDQESTTEIIPGLTPENQIPLEVHFDSENEEQIPLLESPPENDSEDKASKVSKSVDTSIVVPILTDESDDELLFHKDSPQSIAPPDISASAPGDQEIGFQKSETTKSNDNEDKREYSAEKHHPSKPNFKKGLLIFAIIIFVSGISLLIGTLFPGGEESPAPSFAPTQEKKPTTVTLVPTASSTPSEKSSVPSLRPSTNTLMPARFVPSMTLSENPSASPIQGGSELPTISASKSSFPTTTFLPTDLSGNPSASPIQGGSELPTISASKSSLPTKTFSPTDLSENPSASPIQGGSELPTISASKSSLPTTTFSPTGMSLVPSSSPMNSLIPSSVIPSTLVSDHPSLSPMQEGSELPTLLASKSSLPTSTFSPIGMSLVPSFSPMNSLVPSSLIPSSLLSNKPSVTPMQEGSELPTLLASKSSVPTIAFSPNEVSSVPSLSPINTLMPSSLNPSTAPSENPSSPPTQKGSEVPTVLTTISSFPITTLPPSEIIVLPSLQPSAAISQEPSELPTTERSQSPTVSNIISFTMPYKIFILNGLVEFVPESEYIPELITSMDLLTADILLNVVQKRKRIGDTRRLTEVVLPTSIIDVVDVNCPFDPGNSLCREVITRISLVDAEDSWQLFRDTTELAIEIGRLQYYLLRVDRNSPVEVIDALWTPPAPINDPSSDTVSSQSNPPFSNPGAFPTTNPSESPTSLPLFNFLKENSFDGGKALNNISSSQYKAYSWLRDNNILNEYSEEQLLQRYSMATLYFALNGDQWLVNTFWLSDMPECAWFGKTGSQSRCNRKGELVNLELDLNNLKGTLPPELGLLSSALETVTLRGGPNSDILGTLPTELGFLTQLKVFIVRNNDLSGTIPSEIGNWGALKEIDLSRNRFQGRVPTQVGTLSKLSFFEMSVNFLSGRLPSELGLLTKCETMYFEDNAFDYLIPTEIGKLKELNALKGGLNEFDSLPKELGDLVSLDFMSFKESSIAGPIPTELGNLRNLRHLELGNNKLSGSIPSELARIESLQNKLDLSYNQLSGAVPTELGSLVDLRGMKLNNNFLSGTIPSELSRMSKLTSIDLSSNDLSGTIPTGVCETFNITYPAFQTDCGDFDDNCPCCTTCCNDNSTCTCRYLGTSKEFLCFQR